MLIDLVAIVLNFNLPMILQMKGGPGAAVESTVCNRKVPGSSPSLCTFVRERLGAKNNPSPDPAQCGKPTALGTFFNDLTNSF